MRRTPTVDDLSHTLRALRAIVARLTRQCETARRDARTSGNPERYRDALHLQARVQALHRCAEDVEATLDRLRDRS